MTPRRRSASLGDCVRTLIPGSTGVVHDAGYPRRPWISTRQSRHEPKGSRLSVAHNLGIFVPAAAAANITELPSGTLTGMPSISRLMSLVEFRTGVPESLSVMDCIKASRHWRQNTVILCQIELFQILNPEISREMPDGTHDRVGDQTSQPAERTVEHNVAEIPQKVEVSHPIAVLDDLVDHFHTARRANPAWR